MKKWLATALRGHLPGPLNNGPEWMSDLESDRLLAIQCRILSMEDALPDSRPLDFKEARHNYPAEAVVRILGQIVDRQRWELMREAFILLHRCELTFPAIWLPDLLSAPAKSFHQLTTLYYVLPTWLQSWFDKTKELGTYPDDVLKDWEAKLFLPEKFDPAIHTSTTGLNIIQHRIFNGLPIDDSLLNDFWKKANRKQQLKLLIILSHSQNAELFLMQKLKTRSAELKHWIAYVLMKIKGDFYQTIASLAEEMPKGAEWDPAQWPELTAKTISKALHSSLPEDQAMLIGLLDNVNQENLSPEDLTKSLSPPHDDAFSRMIESAILHENIGMAMACFKAESVKINDLQSMACQLLAQKPYNSLLDALIREKLQTTQGIVELINLKTHFFDHRTSLRVIRWLRYDIIDKKPFFAEDIFSALSYRADPKIYPELLAMKEQSMYYSTDVQKPLRECITVMQSRISLRNELQKVMINKK